MGTRLTSRPNSSRRGCWTCKRHHRTCDETQPSCLRCKQYAVECEGYGAKRVAFRPANRTNATAKGRASQNASRSMTAVSYTAAFSPAASECLPQSPKSPLPSPGILSPTTPIGRYQGPLLNQFICEFAPLRSLSPLENIFEEDIAPLALGYLHVRTAIIAVVSALKQTRGSAPRPQFRYNVDAFRHYEEAVRLLRQSVVCSGREKKALSSHHRNSAEETHACLAATYLLTWFEVLVYDPQKWVIHLKALCDLINRGDSSLVQTTFGRRLLHAVARLDCQNALSNRGQPLLEEYWYEMLGSNMRYMSITTADDGDSTGLTEAELEALAVENCRKLHGLLGAAAFLSFEWTSDTPLVANDSLKERVRDILRRLMLWYQMLPSALRWPEDIGNSPSDSATYDEDLHGEFCETDTTFAHDVPHDAIDSQLRKRSHLQKMILLHYYAIRVHLYHILDPVRDPRLMQLSINLAQKCLYVIRALENTPSFPTRRREEMVKEETPFTKFQTQLNTKPSQYPSDMPVSFVFACIGVVLRDPSQREWISEYLMQLGREGIWCGYERALCLHAWWRSDNTISKLKEESSITKRLIKSIPHRHEVPIGSVTTWTPDMGMGVDIMYEILETGEIGFDRYHFSAYMQSQIGKKGP